LEYLHIYEGAVSIKLQDKYSVKSKKSSLGEQKHNMRMTVNKGESFDPLHKDQFFEDEFPNHDSLKIKSVQAIAFNTIYMKMDKYYIKHLFDNKKQH
jgi:hypothetical protein